MSIPVKKFNPVDHMESDKEIIDFLVESYLDDDTPDERIYQRAMEFVLEAKGAKSISYFLKAHNRIIQETKQNPNWRQRTSETVLSAA